MKEYRVIRYKSPEYDEQVQLRYAVLRAPLGLRFTPEYLRKDEKDILFGCFLDGRLVGCGQLSLLGGGVLQLRQMAVAPDSQGQHVGKELVACLEAYAKKEGGKKITLRARLAAQGFYERLGYRAEGAQFLEVGIPHCTMEKEII